MIQIEEVASFLDAWIEIYDVLSFPVVHIVASFLDAWIEIISLDSISFVRCCRILLGCVD